jgi:hypothetical protein
MENNRKFNIINMLLQNGLLVSWYLTNNNISNAIFIWNRTTLLYNKAKEVSSTKPNDLNTQIDESIYNILSYLSNLIKDLSKQN